MSEYVENFSSEAPSKKQRLTTENVENFSSEAPSKKQRFTTLPSPTSHQPTIKQRKFKKIPVYIVDYHNEALNFLYRCLAARYLPFTGNILIHFDSHPDMVISRHIKPTTVFEKDHILDQLSIENWIMPACYAGHFDKIVWLKNSWCDQIPDGSHNFHIGDYDNEMRVDMNTDYFISEGNYCDASLLENAKALNLKVITLDTIQENCQLSGSKETAGVVLDIDLDFFSTFNPFLEVYKNAEIYPKLQKIYTYDRTGPPDEVACRRRKQLDDLEEVFTHLDVHRSLSDFENKSIPSECYQMIIDLVESVISNYPEDEIDWIMVNDAGNTSDNGGLPHHKSSKDELEIYFQNFEKFLIGMEIMPTVVTIARSAEDEYCPKDQVDEIQRRVLETLQKVYSNRIVSKPILAYKGEEWNLLEL